MSICKAFGFAFALVGLVLAVLSLLGVVERRREISCSRPSARCSCS